MTVYTLQWQNDTTNQVQELGVGQYNTLPKAVQSVEHHWRSITTDPNYTCGDYKNSYLCLYAYGKFLYSVQCAKHQHDAAHVRIGFVEYEPVYAIHPLLEVLNSRLLEGDSPELNCWDTNTPAVLTTLAKRYKSQCSVVYVYPDGTEYPIRVDADGDVIDEIPDCWADADFNAVFST